MCNSLMSSVGSLSSLTQFKKNIFFFFEIRSAQLYLSFYLVYFTTINHYVFLGRQLVSARRATLTVQTMPCACLTTQNATVSTIVWTTKMRSVAVRFMLTVFVQLL